jgi:hypothetical protein
MIMTNPETDPLEDVEAYLIAGHGLWSLVVPSLQESILNNTSGNDEGWPKETKDAVRAVRKLNYEETIRLFAKRYAASRR